MINYKVFEVGDGLTSIFTQDEFGTNVIHKSIFDFGYSQVGLFRAINSKEYVDSKTLLISHFHRDHYNALDKINDKSLSIDSLIIPRLPLNQTFANGIKSFLAIQLFYLAESTGFYETDLLKLIQRKNSCSFNVNRKCTGETFTASNVDFNVIWPNTSYLINIRSVRIALNDLANVVDENEDFRTFYHEVLESRFLNEDITEIVFDDLIEEVRKFEIKLTKNQRILIRKANSRLIRAANDICLAFKDQDNSFLSLGDLSNNALRELFDVEFNTPIEFEVILSAHHGTHYTNHSNWGNINSCIVVHSNGKSMSRFYRNEYSTFSRQHHKTDIDKYFESRPIVRVCRIAKISI